MNDEKIDERDLHRQYAMSMRAHAVSQSDAGQLTWKAAGAVSRLVSHPSLGSSGVSLLIDCFDARKTLHGFLCLDSLLPFSAVIAIFGLQAHTNSI